MDILHVLRIRSFSFMIVSEIFSQIAFNMQHFVLIFIIYELTTSNTAVSGMILSFMIPAVLLSIITGIYVDRWNKKKIIILSNLARSILLLPFLFYDLHLGIIYLLTFMIAVATQFFIPAESSVIPSLVPKRLLISANAVFAFGLYGSTFVGYIFAGPILLLLGKEITILFLITMFLISAFFISFVRVPVKEKKIDEAETISLKTHFSFAKEIKELLSFIKKVKKVMHALLMLTVAQAVVFMFAVIAPEYVTEILKRPLESLSVILIAPAGVGLGIGALLLGSIGKKFNRKWLSILAFMSVGVIFIFLPFVDKINLPGVDILYIITGLAFIIGFCVSMVFIPSNATIQIETREDLRGRMYGLLSALIGAISFLPVVIAGGLADVFGVGIVISGVGVLLVVMSIVYIVVNDF
jgi:MFS family permease